MIRFAVASLATVLALLVSPAYAHACWDGHYAHVGNVELMAGGEGEAWSAARARELATWLGRIDALLPHDGSGSVRVEWSTVTVAIDMHETTFNWNGASLAQLFRSVATATGADAATIHAAMSTRSVATTVQTGVFASRSRAEAFAAQVEASGHGEHGFLEVGGFPAVNPVAHIVANADRGARIYRVVVGAFVDIAEAQRVRDALGAGSIVRRL